MPHTQASKKPSYDDDFDSEVDEDSEEEEQQKSAPAAAAAAAPAKTAAAKTGGSGKGNKKADESSDDSDFDDPDDIQVPGGGISLDVLADTSKPSTSKGRFYPFLLCFSHFNRNSTTKRPESSMFVERI